MRITVVSLCKNVLQPLREKLGKPININSCYRCPKLNAAVGGAKTSQHCNGQAADIEINGMSNYDLACYIRDNFEFDQLILEFCDNLKNHVLAKFEFDSTKIDNLAFVCYFARFPKYLPKHL